LVYRWVSTASTTSLTTPWRIWQDLGDGLFSAWTFFCSDSVTWPQFWHVESGVNWEPQVAPLEATE
jgi:hypothetical protein